MAYDIAEAFRRVEEELISSMIRNLKRHRAEETKEGFLWTQWQVEQLAALEEYRRRNRKKFSSEFSQIHKVVGNLINAAREEGNMRQEEEILKAIRDGAKLHKNPDTRMNARFFRMNDRKMNALIKATQDDFREGERAILRQADDQYRRVIFDAQVYANSGAATYEKAVDMATKDFLRAGIQCVEYSNGARHTLSDYADMAIRTAQKRAYLTGEGEKRQEWGTALVIMNKRTDACPKCLPFGGKVMIDDVWSGGKPDGKHMLISTAMSKGLYHPRCRDSHSTYFPGVSTAPDKGWTKEELEALEKDEKKREKLIYAENQAEKYDRLARHSLDPENQRKYETWAEEWGEKSEELTERRKQRLAQRRAAEDTPVKKIVFDDRVSEEQREIIEQLFGQYQTRLQKVDIGAKKAAGEVDMSGASMKLSDKHANTAIHEFAHTLANSSADKYSLTNDQEFWKEIKKIRREYMKDVEGDPSRWISAYEHSGRSLDEFMAEAFTHAKMREMGLDIPGKYGSDFTYSQRVLDTVNKHFGLKTGVSESGRLTRTAQMEADIIDGMRRTAKNLLSDQKIVSYSELSENIRKPFTEGLINADPLVKGVLRKNRSAVDYIESMGHSYYKPGIPGTIMISKSAPPGSLSHEIFHFIDQKKGISAVLKQPLLQDYNNLMKISQGNVKGYLENKYPSAFMVDPRSKRLILRDEYRAISDILNGLSGGTIRYGRGHSKTYWQQNGSLEKEAWAQFGRVYFDNLTGVRKMLTEIFPEFEKNAIIKIKELV